jgi:hypothetical protein
VASIWLGERLRKKEWIWRRRFRRISGRGRPDTGLLMALQAQSYKRRPLARRLRREEAAARLVSAGCQLIAHKKRTAAVMAPLDHATHEPQLRHGRHVRRNPSGLRRRPGTLASTAAVDQRMRGATGGTANVAADDRDAKLGQRGVDPGCSWWTASPACPETGSVPAALRPLWGDARLQQAPIATDHLIGRIFLVILYPAIHKACIQSG